MVSTEVSFFNKAATGFLGVGMGVVALSGCAMSPAEQTVNPPRQIDSKYIGELGNVAGICIADGAKVYDSFPVATSDGKPNAASFGKVLLTVDFDKNPGNGMAGKGAALTEVLADPTKRACIDITTGRITYTTTPGMKEDGKVSEPTYWLAISQRDLEGNPMLSPIANSLSKIGASYVVLTSDATRVDAELSLHNGELTRTVPKTDQKQ